MAKCPVCGMMVDKNTAPTLEYKGKKYYFMSQAHKGIFEKSPEKFANGNQMQSDHDMQM